MPRRQVEGRDHACAASAVDGGALRIIDVTFLHRDAKGRTSYELAELEEHELVPYDVVDETRGLLSIGGYRPNRRTGFARCNGGPYGDRARMDESSRASSAGLPVDCGPRARPTRRRDRSVGTWRVASEGQARNRRHLFRRWLMLAVQASSEL